MTNLERALSDLDQMQSHVRSALVEVKIAHKRADEAEQELKNWQTFADEAAIAVDQATRKIS